MGVCYEGARPKLGGLAFPSASLRLPFGFPSASLRLPFGFLLLAPRPSEKETFLGCEALASHQVSHGLKLPS